MNSATLTSQLETLARTDHTARTIKHLAEMYGRMSDSFLQDFIDTTNALVHAPIQSQDERRLHDSYLEADIPTEFLEPCLCVRRCRDCGVRMITRDTRRKHCPACTDKQPEAAKPLEIPVELNGELVYTNNGDGTFTKTGAINTKVGVFQWFDPVEGWTSLLTNKGDISIEPVQDLCARMEQSGPWKYAAYRILEAKRPELAITPTCACCGMLAGTDCQYACAGLFGRVDIEESLPIEFNDDHQFSLSIKTVTRGKNYDKARPKEYWFNSVRCAELFLIDNEQAVQSKAPVGNGERLKAYLRGERPVDALEAKQAEMKERHAQPQAGRTPKPPKRTKVTPPRVKNARKRRTPNKSYIERLEAKQAENVTVC